MDKLEQQKQIIDLGKLLIEELGLEKSCDTLSRWMAHYIAEKITFIETLPTGQERNEMQKECFESILKLWEHRWTLPSGKRPFESFEPILKALERLDPEQETPFFYDKPNQDDIIEINDHSIMEIDKCMKKVLQIDKIARIWIDFLIQRAIYDATDEKTEAFLRNAICQSKTNIDIGIFETLANIGMDGDFYSKYKQEELEKRIKELEEFTKLNEFIITSYKDEFKG